MYVIYNVFWEYIVPWGRRHLGVKWKLMTSLYTKKWESCLWLYHNPLTKLPIWDSHRISNFRIQKFISFSILVRFISNFCHSISLIFLLLYNSPSLQGLDCLMSQSHLCVLGLPIAAYLWQAVPIPISWYQEIKFFWYQEQPLLYNRKSFLDIKKKE